MKKTRSKKVLGNRTFLYFGKWTFLALRIKSYRGNFQKSKKNLL